MHIVLDTNEIVRALMRPTNLATFIMAWQSARFRIVASQALLAEYEYVLAEPLIASAISPESLRAFHVFDHISRTAQPALRSFFWQCNQFHHRLFAFGNHDFLAV